MKYIPDVLYNLNDFLKTRYKIRIPDPILLQNWWIPPKIVYFFLFSPILDSRRHLPPVFSGSSALWDCSRNTWTSPLPGQVSPLSRKRDDGLIFLYDWVRTLYGWSRPYDPAIPVYLVHYGGFVAGGAIHHCIEVHAGCTFLFQLHLLCIRRFGIKWNRNLLLVFPFQ